MSIPQNQAPQVFKYNSYREYLKALYTHHKQASEGFSYRKFAALAGFKSPNALKLIIEGKRNLTVKSLLRVARGFRLDEKETRFFKQLVLANQAKTPEEKRRLTDELIHGETFKNLYPLKVAQYDLYRRWFTVALREMMASSGFKEDPRWIANLFKTPVAPEEIQSSIENLIIMGLAERDSSGNLRQSQRAVATGHEVDSALVVEFHRKMMELGAAAMENTPRTEREISSSTLFLTEESFARLKVMIQDFRRSLLALEQENDDSEKSVYQVGFQAFPLTRPIPSNEDDQESKSA